MLIVSSAEGVIVPIKKGSCVWNQIAFDYEATSCTWLCLTDLQPSTLVDYIYEQKCLF